MKVNVSVVQVLRYEITKEVEMSYEDYRRYLKTGKYSNELLYEVSGDIDDIHWVETEDWISDIEKVKSIK
jgi:hypothetical protein